MLKQNLKYLRKEKAATQGHIASSIGITRSTLADYENGRSEPKASVLVKLAKYFDINIHDLINTDIDTPLFRKSSTDSKCLENRDIRVVAITLQNNQKQNIEFVPVSAIAGYSKGFENPEYLKELLQFSIPNLSEGTFRAFEIKGDSMPPITESSIVIGKYIEHYTGIKNNKRYIFILRDDGVVFKRVVNEVNQNKRLILVSDNPEYLPFTVKIADVLEAWEMVSFIGYTTEEIDFNQTILNKLNIIEQKIGGFHQK